MTQPNRKTMVTAYRQAVRPIDSTWDAKPRGFNRVTLDRKGVHLHMGSIKYVPEAHRTLLHQKIEYLEEAGGNNE